MTSRWCLFLLTPLMVVTIAGCPRGMPPPVFPEVSSGQSAGGQTGGQTATPAAPQAAPATPAPGGGETASAPPGPPAGSGKSGAPPAVSQGKVGPMGRPPGDAGTRAATKGGATKTGRPGGRGGGWDFMSRLTDDQRKKLDAKVAELRAKNASPQEIFKATGDMLKSWGIEVPDMSRAGGNRRWGGGEFGKLTDEQRRQFFAKMGELRQQNASPEKVRAEAEKMLKGFGLDPSKIQWPTGRGARGAPGGAQPGGPAPQGSADGPTKF